MLRHSLGNSPLDALLGGGLLPGTLTVVVGATGIGKTQLALQYADAGRTQEGRRGVVFDMSARGDSQNHAEYARRICDWNLRLRRSDQPPALDDFFAGHRHDGDYLHLFDYQGRRVTRRNLEFEQWHHWQAELNAKLRTAIAFLYGNFISGCQRLVVDGMEPVDRPHESIQFQLFEYVYHQVVRKDPEWVARDLLRERYRALAEAVAAHPYATRELSCLLLCTSHEAMLEDLISRPLDEGDVLANANTLIYMGKLREGNRIGRGLYVAKHRGSACSDQIIPYQIGERGIIVQG